MRKPWYSALYVNSPIAKVVWGIVMVVISLVIVLFLGLIEEPRMQAQTANWDGRSIETGAALYANNCSSCHGLDGKGLPNVAPALHSKYFFTQRMEDVGWAGTIKDYVELTVAAGRPSKVKTQWAQIMPTWSNVFGGPLRGDQVENLANYVVNWQESALMQSDEEDPWQFFVDAPSKSQPQAETAVEENTEVAGPRLPQDIFLSLGCSGCHNLDENQTADNRGPIGPYMGNLYETAGSRVEGQDAETYVHTSIVEPNAYVNEGYTPGIMPANLVDQISDEELDALVAWLLDPNRQR
ncbi:MAG: cytochrome c [Caldilineaceae bacterium]|nr:cytochrome c [Caldilineaceae bacterium]